MISPSLLRIVFQAVIEDARAQFRASGDPRTCVDYGRVLGAILIEASAAARDLGAPKATILEAVEIAYGDVDGNTQAPDAPISASVH